MGGSIAFQVLVLVRVPGKYHQCYRVIYPFLLFRAFIHCPTIHLHNTAHRAVNIIVDIHILEVSHSHLVHVFTNYLNQFLD